MPNVLPVHPPCRLILVRYALAVAVLAVAVVVAAASVRAQTSPPVILVHGLKSSDDRAWRASVTHLESLGFGTPYSYHFDLNASTSTRAQDDVVGPAVAPFWEYAAAASARLGEAGVPDSLALPFRPDAPRARPAARRGDGTPLVVVNFETYYDADAATLWVHGTRGVSGHSESNCSAVAKQGYALGLVVADVLDWTGADRVVLLGHSMGGLAIREYLQRRTADSAPRWWADLSAEGGHRVAAAVTYGTPHQGSNTVNFGLNCADTEATRDIRYSYLSTGEVAPYLYGGDEDIRAYWHNDDVDADGVEGGPVVGLNVGDPTGTYAYDNPDIPLPTDVAYTYLYSHADAIVTAERQLVRFVGTDGRVYLSPHGSARAVRRDVGHLSQTDDVEMIAWAIQNAEWVSPATAAEPGVAELAQVSVGPNPARGGTTLTLRLAQPADVAVSVVDVLGRTVLSENTSPRPEGETRVPLDLVGLAPGLYLVRPVVVGQSAQAVPITVVR